jgi:pimeloyl-ACP methyl ester carboxylesterase
MAVASEKPPLVLLHPATSSGRIWQDVVPRLSAYHEVHAPTLLGHRGGPAVQRRPATFSDVVDSAERYLDELGLDRPHLAGNSMGGGVAIELARRGRAATVCAISPAGFWSADDGSATRVFRKIRMGGKVFRLINPVAPRVLKSAAGRRLIMRNAACHGERLSADRILDLFFDDPLGCTVTDDLAASGETVEPLDPLPCPVTLAWAEVDRFVAAATYGKTARERLPGATWMMLSGVGHVAMVDDPDLVVRTIMAVTRVLTAE